MRRILAIAGAVAGMITVPSQSLAEADGPDFLRVSGVREGRALFVRTAPERTAPVVGKLDAGTDGIRNLGCQGGPDFEAWASMSAAERAYARKLRWCRIEFSGVTGWAAGWYLSEGSAP